MEHLLNHPEPKPLRGVWCDDDDITHLRLTTRTPPTTTTTTTTTTTITYKHTNSHTCKHTNRKGDFGVCKHGLCFRERVELVGESRQDTVNFSVEHMLVRYDAAAEYY